MLSRYFVRNIQSRITVRWFTRNSIMRDTNKTDKIPVEKTTTPATQYKGVLGAHMYRVKDFDKKILVWVKRYPSIAEVPREVTTDCMLTARSKARIKVCNYMIVFTIIGCIIAAIIGKREAAKGNTLFKMRQDWYENIIAQKKDE